MDLDPWNQSQQRAKANSKHVLRLDRQLADGNRPGVLATVDRTGAPHLRWMATFSLREFPHLYALTAPCSRKIEDISRNPRVSWMFTTEGATMVVNLTGTATLISEKSEVSRIWHLIDNKANAFFLGLHTATEGVAVIDTLIEDVECTVPRYDLHYPVKGEDFPKVPLNS
jgi:general stress protein 26